jgi:hypothetical protein
VPTPASAENAETERGLLTTQAGSEIAHAAREQQILLSGLRIRLAAPGTSVAGPFVAQANAYADGRAIRVEVTGDTAQAAARALVARCAARLTASAKGWSPRPWPDPSRTGQPGPPLVHRAYGRIVRTKAVVPTVCRVEVAAATMDALDYDAHLFTDEASGEHAVIYRGGPVGYRVAFVRRTTPSHTADLPVVTDPKAAPELVPVAAAARLDTTLLPFLLFADPATGQARLLYRRYDGDYGLVTPTSTEPGNHRTGGPGQPG